MAASGALGMLGRLLQRHPYALTPHLLDILSCLPETLTPASFAHLLPKVCIPGVAVPPTTQHT